MPISLIGMNLPGAKILAVGGGKGGIGKSICTANLGIALARRGKRVILIDSDLGGANLHTYLGITFPKLTLGDFILRKKATLQEVLIPTETANLQLITGATDILGMANPKFPQKQRLIQAISKLSADFILIDLGAGTDFNVLDFFNTSSEGIVIVCPEPASIQNGYSFIKNALYRKINLAFFDNTLILDMLQNTASPDHPDGCKNLQDFGEKAGSLDPEFRTRLSRITREFRPRIVVNMTQGPKDATVSKALCSTAKKYLDIDLEYIGHIPMDGAVKHSARYLKPFYIADPSSPASRGIDGILDVLLRPGPTDANDSPEKSAPPMLSVPEVSDPMPAAGSQEPVPGINENVDFEGRTFHVQTEDLGPGNPVVRIQVFSAGRVVFNKTVSYEDQVPPGDREALAGFLRQQHQTLLSGVQMGRLRFT